jgi:hypothetical protein
MLSSGMSVIAESPIIGSGVGSYSPLARRHSGMLAEYNTRGWISDPHNELLQVGAELGLLGVAALLAGLIGLWRLAGRFQDEWRWLTRGGIGIYVAAGLANGVLHIGWNGSMLGVFLGLVAGHQALRQTARAPARHGPIQDRPA